MGKLTKADKAEKRLKNKQQKEFRALHKQVVKKLKKAAMTKAIRLEIFEDMTKCNNMEIMHYLATEAEFSSDHEFVEVVNKNLLFETTAHNYAFDLVYKIGNMEEITEKIIDHHKTQELRAMFIKPVDSE